MSPSFDPSYVRDRLRAGDPDGSRLVGALRATVAAALATGALIALFPDDRRTLFAGIVVAANGSILPADASARGRRITALLLPAVAVAAFAAGTITPANVAVHAVLLAAVAFVAVAARRRGPRGGALGTMVFWGYVFAEFLGTKLDALPTIAAGIAVGGALALLTRLATPERPASILRSADDAVQCALACVVYRAIRALEGAPIAKIDRDLALLNAAALAVDDAAALLDAGVGKSYVDTRIVRARVFATEIAANRLVATIETLRERRIPVDVLRLVRLAVRDPKALSDARRATATIADPALLRFRHVVTELLSALDEGPASADEVPLRAAVLAPSPTMAAVVPPNVLAQAPLSVVVALLLGNMLAPSRGSWAVIAAFVVFTRATTFGLVMARAWQRVAGTLVGVVAGLLLADVLVGHRALELATVFASMFVAYYALKESYATFAGAFSLLLAIVYGLTGTLTTGVLVLRVAETFIGGMTAVIVAKFVVPAHPEREVLRRAALVMNALADHVACATAGAGARSAAVATTRILDRRFRQLREVGAGLMMRRFFGVAPDLARSVGALSAAVFSVRPLAQTAVGFASTPSLASAIVIRARALAADMDRRAGGSQREEPERDERRTDPMPEPAPDLQRTLAWLTRASDALAVLERLRADRDAAPP